MSTTDESLIVRMLLAVRTKHEWSQEELARVLLVSRRTVQRWEAGTIEPPVYLTAALRELLT